MKIFKTITIGGISKEQLLERLSKAGIQFNKYANILFENPQFSPQKNVQQVTLVKLAPEDLGLNNPCSYQEIVKRASALGLEECPLYLSAFLRLEYLDQPVGPYLTIASKKLEDHVPNGFYIRNIDNSLWLRGYQADDFCEWPSENEFVFQKYDT